MAALETIILDIPGVTSGCFGNVCCISFVLIFFLFVCLFDDYLHSSLTQFNAGADPGFQVGGGGGGGAHLKKLRREKGGANIFGVFRVKNHDFTPKNLIFPILGGGARNFWGISCEKSRF